MYYKLQLFKYNNFFKEKREKATYAYFTDATNAEQKRL